MAKKRSTSFSSYKSGLGSYPLAVKPGEFLETTTVVPEMTPINASGAMQYQNFSTGKSYLNQTNDAFVDAGFDPYKQSVASAIASNPIAASTSLSQSGLGSWGDGMNAPLPKKEAAGSGSYLGDWGKALGFTGWGDGRSNGETYKDPVTGKQMVSGMFTDRAAGTGDFNTFAAFKEANKDSTLTEEKWNDAKFNQGRLDSQNTMNLMSGGLGAANTVLGAMSYFDSKALNKKNMQLIDQQIANNQDAMRTRTERAGDIKKYFG